MSVLFQLFFAIIQVGLFSVGGGYAANSADSEPDCRHPQADDPRRVHRPHTIAEMTPGPISINSATFVGTRLAGIPGAVLCTLGCIIPSFIICLTLAHFYYKYRNFSGVQTVLSALRPAVVALIASAGLSILLLGLFMSDLSGITLANFRPIETCLFIGGLFLLRKYRVNAIAIIFGTGVVGTLAYSLLGMVA